MRNVARSVGLGGLGALILACAMAAPAVAEMQIRVPAVQVKVHLPSVGHPTQPSFKAVVPHNSNSKSNPGGKNLISRETDPSSPVLWKGLVSTPHTFGSSNPALRFTLNSLGKPHANELDDDPPDYPTPGGEVPTPANNVAFDGNGHASSPSGQSAPTQSWVAGPAICDAYGCL